MTRFRYIVPVKTDRRRAHNTLVYRLTPVEISTDPSKAARDGWLGFLSKKLLMTTPDFSFILHPVGPGKKRGSDD